MNSVDMQRRNPPPGFKPDYITTPLLQDRAWDVCSLVIDISGSCNMACRYCVEAITMPKRRPMSPETFDSVWRFLFPNGIKAVTEETDLRKKAFSIHMGCGEPLLNFSLMQKIGERVKQACSEGVENFFVFLTTNALLMDEKIMDWLIASNWNIKISLDGSAAIHDRWRVLPGGEGTYERTVESLTYMAARIPDRVTAGAVICRGTDPAEVFETIASLGVRRFEMLPVAHTDESIIPTSGDSENYRDFIMNYAARFLENDNANGTKGTNTTPPAIIINFNQAMMRLMGYQLSRVNCSAGRTYLGVGPGGGLYPCGRFIGIEKYRLGHIAGGLDREARQAFLKGAGRPYDRREPCSRCWAAPLCTGPCFACAEMFGPGHGHPIDINCAYMLADAEAASFLYQQLKQHNPEKLLAFLPTLSDEFFD